MLTIYREGEGDTPTYLCEVHAEAERDLAPVPRPNHRPSGDDSLEPQVDRALNREAIVSSNETGPTGHLLRKKDNQVRDRQIASAEIAAPKPNVTINPTAPSEPVVCTPQPAAAAPAASTKSASKPKPPAPEPSVLRPKMKAAAPAAPKTVSPVVSQAPTIPAAKVPSSPKVNPSSKGSVRDLTYGNPAKALVDETIWNLQPGDYDAYRAALREGKSPLDAAQAAGGQFSVVHRKIHEYLARIDALLSASNATINVDDVIQRALEAETSKVISNDAMTDERKDATLAQLGEFQEWVNRALKHAATPVKAHEIALAVADRAHWGSAAHSMPNELGSAYRAVYGSLRDAVHAAVPDARDPDERLANLFAAKSDLETLHGGAPISAPDHLRAAPSGSASTHEEKFAEI
ncbi:MAG TPA: hypothetical protein VMF66_02115 [Candidatus Acidoferrum sp.]|nr:hypothetical protein [Candidatus Acidoferrum sp.]